VVYLKLLINKKKVFPLIDKKNNLDTKNVPIHEHIFYDFNKQAEKLKHFNIKLNEAI
jgi:hypothetical protein